MTYAPFLCRMRPRSFSSSPPGALKAGLCVIVMMIVGTGATATARDIIDAMNADEIAALMHKAGFEPQILPDRDTGAPVGVGRVGAFDFVVRALECSGTPLSCRRLLFFANFNLNRRLVTADYKAVNRFNESHPDGRAYLIEDSTQMGVDYIIDLTGGVTPAHVTSRLRRWKGVVKDLADGIEARAPQS